MSDVWTYSNGKEINHQVIDIPIGFDNGRTYGSIQGYSTIINGKNNTGTILLPENMMEGEKFPVLYLLNGQGGNGEWEDPSKGRVQQILGYMFDNLILKKPFVVVMPDIFGPNTISDDQKMSDYQSLEKILPPYNDSEGLMAYIVNNFPVLAGKANSSIAGLSMGGVASLFLGFKLQEYFYSIGSFSPVSVLFSQDLGWLDPNTVFIFGSKHDHFIFIGKGLNDQTVNGYPGFYRDKLNDFGNDNTYCTVPGGHSWSEYNQPGPFRTLLYMFLLNTIFDCQ
jgi:S-formylglutathione hydrolase FrmB